MTSYFRLALLAGLLPLSAMAGDSQPPNIYSAIVRHRVQQEGAKATFDGTTHEFLDQLLEEPGSPYSEVQGEPRLVNQVWWPEVAEHLFPQSSHPGDDALGALHTQMGLTKARPGIDVVIDDYSARTFRGRESAAQASKARVQPDIFWQARDMNGSRMAEAAGEAVALQILHDQVERNDPSTYSVRAIRPEVLQRYMAQQNASGVSDDDRHYLGAILRTALASTSPAYEDGGTLTGLPTIYRVARVAAAYADAQGYDAVLCSGTEPAPDLKSQAPPDYKGPLCFIAATDRAVRAWYQRELRWEQVRHASRHEEGFLARLMHWIAPVLFLVEGAAFLEFIEAAVADDMLAEGVIEEEEAALASDRVTRLSCRIH